MEFLKLILKLKNACRINNVDVMVLACQATWAVFADTSRHSRRKSIRMESCRPTAPKPSRNITWHRGLKLNIRRSTRNSKWWCNGTSWTVAESALEEVTTTCQSACPLELTTSHCCKLVHRCIPPLVHGHRLRKPIQVFGT